MPVVWLLLPLGMKAVGPADPIPGPLINRPKNSCMVAH